MDNILINYLGRNNAGPTYSIEVARAIACKGYRVYAIISAQTMNLNEWQNDPLIYDVYSIDTYSNNKEFIAGSVRLFLYEKHKIKKHYNGIHFACVVRPFFHLWSVEIDKCVDTDKRISICHDPVPHSGTSFIEAKLAKDYVKKSDKIVVLTKSFIPIIRERYGFSEESISYMPDGLISTYNVMQKSLKYKIYDQTKVNFLFFGRVQKYKGLHILAQAFKKVNAERPNTHLYIVCNGDFSEYQEEYNGLQDTTVVNGYIPDEEVGNYFDDSSVVVVLPYIDATQSAVISVAISYELPILATDTGGLKEQLFDGELGFFVPACNIDRLAAMMIYIIDHPEEREEQKKLSAEYKPLLEWDNLIENLIRLF